MMQRNRTSAAALWGAVLVVSPASAQFVGLYAGEFMAAGAGARTLAMGGAAGAAFGDPWSLFGNPAGLSSVTRPQLSLMHSERFAGVVDYDAAAFAAPQPDGMTLAVGALRLGVNGIPFTRKEDPGRSLGNDNVVEVEKIVSDGEYAFFVARAGTASSRWLEGTTLEALDFQWGVAPKLIFKHIGSYRAYGLGVDVGALKMWGERPRVAVGFSARDLLGTVLAWEQTGRKEVILSTLRLGTSAMMPLPALEADLTLAADGAYRVEALGESKAGALHAGVEYLVRKCVALRAGTDDGRLTFGGGIDLKPFALDYAFIRPDDLGDTHRISVTARWGR